MKKQGIKVVTVFNNKELFEKVIKKNECVKDFELFEYDNTSENVGIPKRYNDFIDKNVKNDSNFWIIFCHQDFGFDENPQKVISRLNKKSIYGAIGMKKAFSFSKFFKSLVFLPFGCYFSVKFNFSDLKHILTVEKKPSEGLILSRRVLLGKIKQGCNDEKFEYNGMTIYSPKAGD